MKKITQLCCILMLFFCFSCNDDDFNGDQSNSNAINFNINVLSQENTRGIPIESEKDTAFKTMGVMGYYTNDLFENTTDPTSSFFANALVTKNKENKWAFDRIYYWPQNGYISFFAYSPYATSNNGIKITAEQTGPPTLTYTLPSEVENQPDLMVAAPKMNLYKNVVDLNYSHALSCISFIVNGPNVPIEYIGIKGVYTTGELSLNMDKQPVWISRGGLSDQLYKVGLVKNPIASDPSTDIMEYNGYLMMIPQTLDPSAEIVVKFQGIDEKSIKFSDSDTKEWIAGDKYVYTLKEGKYRFRVSPADTTCTYAGGKINLNIISEYIAQNNKPQKLGWNAEIVSASPNIESWTDLFNNLSDAVGGIITKSIDVTPSTFKTDTKADVDLRSVTPVEYANIADLSKINNRHYTANTYVANSAGWFKIPCTVMGNAIKGSGNIITPNNAQCINRNPSNFVNYLGTTISNISQLKIDYIGATAELIWCDAPGLISKVQMSANNQYIEFYIPPQSLRQGNAIIAIKKGGNIMWSWQIWVTNWKLNTQNQNIGNGNPNIMPFAVGRCSAGKYEYDQRSITIKFTQNTTNLVQTVTITQKDSTIILGENASYYQWGRKDPMLASNGLNTYFKPDFGDNKFFVDLSATPQDLKNGILNPNIFYTSSGKPGNWFKPYTAVLWGNFSAASALFVKTIYDPCPIGYQVPTFQTISSFVSMGYELVDTPIRGCKFSPNNNGDYTVFLASYGIIHQEGNLADIDIKRNIGFYWSNSNYKWDSDDDNEKEFGLNLIFPSTSAQYPIFYQASPTATGINVFGSVEQNNSN